MQWISSRKNNGLLHYDSSGRRKRIKLNTMFQKKTKTHEENRAIICAGCGKKDNKCAKVTPNIETLIQDEISTDYISSDYYLPTGICGSCRRHLFASKKGKPIPTIVRDRWKTICYSTFERPSRSTPCLCSICKKSRFTGEKLESKESPDVPRQISEEQEVAEIEVDL